MNSNDAVSYDTPPTCRQYNAFQAQFDYFNNLLFGGELPNLKLTFSRKGKNIGGFFSPDRWRDGDVLLHEIALNPDHWKNDPDHTISILVHEMAHHWQQVFGKPARRGHHNKEWGKKMKEIGPYPSNTGAPGGKETGQQMTHYVIEGGGFEMALKEMPEDIRLPLAALLTLEVKPKSKQKTKYECPLCGAKVWGKENLHAKCDDCDEPFEQAEKERHTFRWVDANLPPPTRK